MRIILLLALSLTCVSAASAADDSVTKRNNDASLRKTQHMQLPVVPLAPVVKPAPQDSAPTK